MESGVLEAVRIRPVWIDLGRANDWQMNINFFSAVFTGHDFGKGICRGSAGSHRPDYSEG